MASSETLIVSSSCCAWQSPLILAMRFDSFHALRSSGRATRYDRLPTRLFTQPHQHRIPFYFNLMGARVLRGRHGQRLTGADVESGSVTGAGDLAVDQFTLAQ